MATLNCSSRTKRADATIRSALRILEQEMRDYGPSLCSPKAVRDYLRLRLESEEREVVGCLFLNAQNQLLEWNPMFYGTLTQATVYRREIVRRALLLNAACVILAHNHPSGSEEPSPADKWLTRAICDALNLVDVKVLDHFVIGGAVGRVFSFAEHGLIES